MSGTSAIPGSHPQVSVASGREVTYGMGYQGPRDYVVDSRSPAGYSRQGKKRGGSAAPVSTSFERVKGLSKKKKKRTPTRSFLTYGLEDEFLGPEEDELGEEMIPFERNSG